MKGVVEFEIKGLDKILKGFARSPQIMEEEMQKAISVSADILAKNTYSNKLPGGTVPYRTGMLVQTFQRDVSRLLARWYPTRYYAPYVQFGTRFMKANPYMNKIATKSSKEINEAFSLAADRAVKKMIE